MTQSKGYSVESLLAELERRGLGDSPEAKQLRADLQSLTPRTDEKQHVISATTGLSGTLNRGAPPSQSTRSTPESSLPGATNPPGLKQGKLPHQYPWIDPSMEEPEEPTER